MCSIGQNFLCCPTFAFFVATAGWLQFEGLPTIQLQAYQACQAARAPGKDADWSI